ncbi:MAG: 16S rRNA (cytosine(1402)-N(4))-methyltransferase RsmH [Bacteroidaceae bacterium]|nr:16S rRNA (cytosine(1402)-N(4))-methyltransferase RsmH [Bacteroidaceae bacterium]
MNCETYHKPVMLEESLEALNIQADGIYVDMTYGGGGHSRALVSRLGKEGRLYGFDQDIDAMKGAMEDERFTFVRSNFRFLKNWMQYYEVDGVDGILADLGVSSHHFDEGERGFSFRYDAPLDMRMNQAAKLTAAKVVNEYSEEQLADIFYLYGEMKNSRKLAATLIKARKEAEIKTTGQLADLMKPLLGRDREKKDLAKVFQALRIEVNGEMKALRQMLNSAIEVLKPGGRLVVLTYHSLEDRMVKNIMKSGNIEGKTEQDFYGNLLSPLRPVKKGVMTPSENEQQENPRSRSAKLRIAEKV